MTAMIQRQLETGWLPTTPVDDNVLRQFIHSQAVVNQITATAAGGSTHSDDDVFLADTGGPIPYLNQALLTRPLTGPGDPVLGTVESFFADAFSTGRSMTLLSLWPTPDITPEGWSLVGHPAMVLRSPGPVTNEPAPGVETRLANSAEGRMSLGSRGLMTPMSEKRHDIAVSCWSRVSASPIITSSKRWSPNVSAVRRAAISTARGLRK